MAQTLSVFLKALMRVVYCLAFEVVELFRTAIHYYPNAQFRRADLRCHWAYLMRNSPYTSCERYLRNLPNDRVQKTYGETSFGTLDRIAAAVGLSENDVVYDLGCGRGRGVFWLNAFYKCRAVGVEIFPEFVMHARGIQKKLRLAGVEFVYANLMDLDYADATVIYLYGTAFADEAIAKLVDRFQTLKPGTRVVTVSYPLNDYCPVPLFRLENAFSAPYAWGVARVFVQRRL